jgi:hypothetical protein
VAQKRGRIRRNTRAHFPSANRRLSKNCTDDRFRWGYFRPSPYLRPLISPYLPLSLHAETYPLRCKIGCRSDSREAQRMGHTGPLRCAPGSRGRSVGAPICWHLPDCWRSASRPGVCSFCESEALCAGNRAPRQLRQSGRPLIRSHWAFGCSYGDDDYTGEEL